MMPSRSSIRIVPGARFMENPSPHITRSVGSSGLLGIRTGRRPTRSDRSATLAARWAERTEANVATPSTIVPAAVPTEAIVAQSAIGASRLDDRAPGVAAPTLDHEADAARVRAHAADHGDHDREPEGDHP